MLRAPASYAVEMTSANTDVATSLKPAGQPIPSDESSSQLNVAFLRALRPALEQLAISEKAAGMARYMKSAMPYMGVPSPSVRKTVRALAKLYPFSSPTELGATVTSLWNDASFREERYAAIMLTDSHLGRGDIGLLPFYTLVIETGQWWDYVDSIAPRLSELLQLHRASIEPLLRSWSVHTNFWFRRASIIAQLPAKSATDTVLLTELIRPNLADKEFFIRKAIGWALRQYARTDPDWVRSFVAHYESQLSPLSRREALKRL